MNNTLHKAWQLLPHTLRRKALNNLSLWSAPHLVPTNHSCKAPWIVVGVLSASTGLGEAARLALEAFSALGEPVSFIDLTSPLQQVPSVQVPELCPVQEGPGTILMFLNPPVSAMALRMIPRKILEGKRLIGCWVWEFEEAPPNWYAHAKLFHDIVAPSHFAAASIAKTIKKPVRVLPHPVAASTIEHVISSARPFTVGLVGDVVAAADRKNVVAAVQAFIHARLKAGTARLKIHLHGNSPSAQPVLSLARSALQSGFDITITTGVRSRSDARSFYSSLDLYLSLHRSEGFGLTVAEAMLAGVPVLSTNWSATAEFVDASVGYPVPFKLLPSPGTVDDPRLHPWAEPDIEVAASYIRQAFLDQEERSRRGEAARARAEMLFSAAEFMNHLAHI